MPPLSQVHFDFRMRDATSTMLLINWHSCLSAEKDVPVRAPVAGWSLDELNYDLIAILRTNHSRTQVRVSRRLGMYAIVSHRCDVRNDRVGIERDLAKPSCRGIP